MGNNKVRGRFSPPARVTSKNNEPSLTQKHFADDADINAKVRRHLGPGGTFRNPRGDTPLTSPGASPRQPQFGDFYNANDFMRMQNLVIEVRNKFMALPSRLRGRFNNDPYSFLTWLENPANKDLAIKYGFLPGASPLETMDQVDLVNELERLTNEAKRRENEAPKADSEAQPGFTPKGGKKTAE